MKYRSIYAWTRQSYINAPGSPPSSRDSTSLDWTTLFLIVETQDFSWPERRTRVLRRCLGSFWSDTSSWRSSGWLPMKGLIYSLSDAPETWTPLYVTFSLNRHSQTDPFSSCLSIPKRLSIQEAVPRPLSFLASPALSVSYSWSAHMSFSFALATEGPPLGVSV